VQISVHAPYDKKRNTTGVTKVIKSLTVQNAFFIQGPYLSKNRSEFELSCPSNS
jgi:hypothetical protein